MNVSVIIVTRNTRELTLAAIASVFGSEGGFSREVLVVDNGSTDGTEAAVRTSLLPVKYQFSERNLGFGGANNLAARSATGEFLLLLNSDARLQARSLGDALDWMRANPQCGLAGAQLLNPDGSRQNSIANDPTLATELLNKSILRRAFPTKYPGKESHFTVPTPVESVIGAFFLTRRALWEVIGGFDPRYFFFFEETDFCRAVRATGKSVMHLPQINVWHAQGRSAGQWPAAARIEYWRSRNFYFAKHCRPLACAVLRAGLLVRLVADFALNGLATLVTIGRSERLRRKFSVQRVLLSWHLRGCPDHMGLPR